MDKIDYLLELVNNRTSLKNLTGNNKKAYKYIISGIFINIINGLDHKEVQTDLYGKAEHILVSSRHKGKISNEGVLLISEAVKKSMESSYILNSEDPDVTTKIISILRNKLRDIKKGKTLFQAVELSEIMDIKSFMLMKGTPFIHNHHWLDFNIEHGITHTTPVFILLGDLKIHWNHFVELTDSYKDYQYKMVPGIPQHEFDLIYEVREMRHSYSGIYRTMIFTVVTFVEAYLLEVFINIKEVYPEERVKHKAFINDSKITDLEIMNNVIFKIYPEIKTTIHAYFDIYKEILKYRDRYVHASLYKEEHSDLSKLQYLLDYELSTVVKYLNACVLLVKGIDDLLPENIQSLYWWDRVEFPDFSQGKKISLLSQIKHYKKLEDYGF
jgi:hypothetical protein